MRNRSMEFIRLPSGASLLLLPSADNNKVFSVNFATPPSDDSGAAHAVEHCVLRGSRAYPADDPFGELSAGYLYTYLNAITYPDRTVYPAASLLEGAFYQMLDVYMDAAFNPLLRPEAFRQEVSDGCGGIIRSEMAALFSDPAEILKREANRRLFRGSPYEFFAPGTPEGVAGLKYADFADFYRRFYNPGNCFVYLYGNLDFDRAVTAIEPYLSGNGLNGIGVGGTATGTNFIENSLVGNGLGGTVTGTNLRENGLGGTATETNLCGNGLNGNVTGANFIENGLGGNVTEPHSSGNGLNGTAAGTNFNGRSKAQSPPANEAVSETRLTPEAAEPCAGVFFRACPITDILSLGALEVLRIYLEAPFSAFTRLLSEKMGRRAEVSVNSDGREAVFGVIFRNCGASPEKAREAVVSALCQAANDICADGLDWAAEKHRFAVLEAKTGYKPRGLSYGLRMYQNWLYGGEQSALDCLKTASAADALRRMPPDFYADFLKRRLAGNAGAVSLNVLPGRAGRVMTPIARTISERSGPVEKNRDKIPPASFSFPRLSIKRAEIKPDFVPVEYDDSGRIPVLRHRLETRGVAYISAFFSLAALPPRLRAAAPVAARLMGKFPAGGKGASGADLFTRRNFGEFDCGIAAYPLKRPGSGPWDYAAFFRVRAKMSADKAQLFFDAVQMLLEDCSAEDSFAPTLRDALAEAVLSLRKPEAAARRSLAMFLPEAAFDENANGEGFARSLRLLLDDYDSRYPLLLEMTREFAWALRGSLALVSVAGTESERVSVPPVFSLAAEIAAKDADLAERPDDRAAEITTNYAVLAERPACRAAEIAAKNAVLTGRPGVRAAEIAAKDAVLGERPDIRTAEITAKDAVLTERPAVRSAAGLSNLAQSFPLETGRYGHALVLASALKNYFLTEEIRLKGGAYGADCVISRRAAALLAFSDPNPQKTLDTFKKIPEYIRRIPAEEARRSAVAALNGYLRPLSPEERVGLSLERFFLGIDEKEIGREIDGIFSAGPEDLRKYADSFENGLKKEYLSIIAL